MAWRYKYIISTRGYILIFILMLLFMLTMINAPNILVGYGLIIPAMMISLIFLKPRTGITLFFISHLIATVILIYTSSTFAEVAILSLIVRTVVVGVLGYYIEKGKLKSLLTLLILIVVLDVYIAYSIGLLYFGHDAIEVGLDIYSLIYIPFIYLSKKLFDGGKLSFSIATIFSMVLYYFSAAYFFALPLFILSIVLLLVFAYEPLHQYGVKLLGISLLVIIILIPLSAPYIIYNALIISYPLNPKTLIGKQWINEELIEGAVADVMAGVWNPSRLRIVDPAVKVTGTVVTEYFIAEDGDICFDVELDPEYTHMLSIGSYVLRRGRIHVEIVPMYQDEVKPPNKGDRVELIGAWVVDTDHGSWSEIHPVWRIRVLPKE